MTSILLLGLLLGMRHALEADHVAAVTTLVTRASSVRSGLFQGIVWGVGHTFTLFTAASIVLLNDSVIPVTVVQWLEVSVAVMLIVLGLEIAWRLTRERVHFHVHQHADGVRHFHAHSHRAEPASGHDINHHQHQHSRGLPMRALLMGLMQGLAGSAALIVLSLEHTTSLWQGLLYIVLFGFGSILGMVGLSAIIALPLMRIGAYLTWFHRAVQSLAGVVNIGLGTILLHHALSGL